MKFRVTIVTPIQVDAADLARRVHRYGERASSSTEISVIGLPSGPTALESVEDLAASDAAVLEACRDLGPRDCDALLVDCIFDPSVEVLQQSLPIPVFGPLATTLRVLPSTVKNVAMVARVDAHIPVFDPIFRAAGKKARFHALNLPYSDARHPETFDAAMASALQRVVSDGADGIVMGSTTMALAPNVARYAGPVPLFLTGMLTLGVMESLWQDGALGQSSALLDAPAIDRSVDQ